MPQTLTLLLFLLFSPLSLSYTFQQNEYRELRNHALQLLQHCPPSTCTLISVGRSPAPLIAFLRALQTKPNTIEIPLSKYRRNPPSLETPEGKILLNHLKKHLTPAGDLNNRTIMIVDYINSGESLQAITKTLQQYAPQLGLKREAIRPLPIVDQFSLDFVLVSSLKQKLEVLFGDYPWINIERSATLCAYLQFQDYDDYAPYNSYDISNPQREQTVQLTAEGKERYGDFLATLKEKIAADPLLQEFRTTQSPYDEVAEAKAINTALTDEWWEGFSDGRNGIWPHPFPKKRSEFFR